MNVNYYVDKINDIEFDGMEEIKCGNAMKFSLNFANISNLTILKSFFHILKNFLFQDYESIGQGKTFCFYSNQYKMRTDYWNCFKNVISLIDDKIIVKPSKKRHLFLNFKSLKYLLKWNQKIKRKIKVDIKTRAYIISILYIAYANLEFIKKCVITKVKPKLTIVFCDAHLIDSIVVQYCNSIGIKTATLEHGIFEKGPKYNELSYSDYFLGYGEYVKKMALESGMKPKKFLSVGMPQLIGHDIAKEIDYKKNNKIGLIFSGEKYADEDVEMLQIAIEFAKKNNYKILIKLHPRT